MGAYQWHCTQSVLREFELNYRQNSKQVCYRRLEFSTFQVCVYMITEQKVCVCVCTSAFRWSLLDYLASQLVAQKKKKGTIKPECLPTYFKLRNWFTYIFSLKLAWICASSKLLYGPASVKKDECGNRGHFEKQPGTCTYYTHTHTHNTHTPLFMCAVFGLLHVTNSDLKIYRDIYHLDSFMHLFLIFPNSHFLQCFILLLRDSITYWCT